MRSLIIGLSVSKVVYKEDILKRVALPMLQAEVDNEYMDELTKREHLKEIEHLLGKPRPGEWVRPERWLGFGKFKGFKGTLLHSEKMLRAKAQEQMKGYLKEQLEALRKTTDDLPITMRHNIDELLDSSEELIGLFNSVSLEELEDGLDDLITEAYKLQRLLAQVRWGQVARESDDACRWWIRYANLWTSTYELARMRFDLPLVHTAFMDTYAVIFTGLFFPARLATEQLRTGREFIDDEIESLFNEVRDGAREVLFYPPIEIAVKQLSGNIKLSAEESLQLHYLLEDALARKLAQPKRSTAEIVDRVCLEHEYPEWLNEKTKELIETIEGIIDHPNTFMEYKVSEWEDLGQGLERCVVMPDLKSSNIVFLRYKDKKTKKYSFVMVDGGSALFVPTLKNEVFKELGITNPKKQIKKIIITHGDPDHLGGLVIAQEFNINFRADASLFKAILNRGSQRNVPHQAFTRDITRIARGFVEFDQATLKRLGKPYALKSAELMLGGFSFDFLGREIIGDTAWAIVRLEGFGHSNDSLLMIRWPQEVVSLALEEGGTHEETLPPYVILDVDGAKQVIPFHANEGHEKYAEEELQAATAEAIRIWNGVRDKPLDVISGDMGVDVKTMLPGQFRVVKAFRKMTGLLPDIEHIYGIGVHNLLKSLFKRVTPAHGEPYVNEPVQAELPLKESAGKAVVIGIGKPSSDSIVENLVKEGYSILGATHDAEAAKQAATQFGINVVVRDISVLRAKSKLEGVLKKDKEESLIVINLYNDEELTRSLAELISRQKGTSLIQIESDGTRDKSFSVIRGVDRFNPFAWTVLPTLVYGTATEELTERISNFIVEATKLLDVSEFEVFIRYLKLSAPANTEELMALIHAGIDIIHKKGGTLDFDLLIKFLRSYGFPGMFIDRDTLGKVVAALVKSAESNSEPLLWRNAFVATMSNKRLRYILRRIGSSHLTAIMPIIWEPVGKDSTLFILPPLTGYELDREAEYAGEIQRGRYKVMMLEKHGDWTEDIAEDLPIISRGYETKRKTYKLGENQAIVYSRHETDIDEIGMRASASLFLSLSHPQDSRAAVVHLSPDTAMGASVMGILNNLVGIGESADGWKADIAYGLQSTLRRVQAQEIIEALQARNVVIRGIHPGRGNVAPVIDTSDGAMRLSVNLFARAELTQCLEWDLDFAKAVCRFEEGMRASMYEQIKADDEMEPALDILNLYMRVLDTELVDWLVRHGEQHFTWRKATAVLTQIFNKTSSKLEAHIEHIGPEEEIWPTPFGLWFLEFITKLRSTDIPSADSSAEDIQGADRIAIPQIREIPKLPPSDEILEIEIFGMTYSIPRGFWESIRPAEERDLEDIARLYPAYPYPNTKLILPDNPDVITGSPTSYWVFEYDEKILGFVGIERHDDDSIKNLEVKVIRTDLSLTGSGISFALYAWSLFQAQEEGYTVIIFGDDIEPDSFRVGRSRDLRQTWGERFTMPSDDEILDATNTKRNNFAKWGYERITGLFPEDAQSILEVGSGSAKNLIQWTKESSDRRAFGLDVAKAALITGRRGAQLREVEDKVHFIEHDTSYTLPLPDDSFDAVFNEGVLEHYPNEEIPQLVEEMVRVTKPGGNVVIAVPNYYSFSLRFAFWFNGVDYKDVSDTYSNWRYGYEQPQKPEFFKDIFERYGLTDIEIDGFAPLYGFGVYKWDAENQRAIYPWFTPIVRFMVKIIDPIIEFIDRKTDRWISRRFGYEFVIKGVKPINQPEGVTRVEPVASASRADESKEISALSWWAWIAGLATSIVTLALLGAPFILSVIIIILLNGLYLIPKVSYLISLHERYHVNKAEEEGVAYGIRYLTKEGPVSVKLATKDDSIDLWGIKGSLHEAGLLMIASVILSIILYSILPHWFSSSLGMNSIDLLIALLVPSVLSRLIHALISHPSQLLKLIVDLKDSALDKAKGVIGRNSFPVLLFAPGPTPIPEVVQKAWSLDTSKLSRERLCEEYLHLTNNIRPFYGIEDADEYEVVTYTSSGTGGLEASILNTTVPGDTILVVNAGKFGERFKLIGEKYNLNIEEIEVEWGRAVDPGEIRDRLEQNQDIKLVLVQHSETSTGVAHPIDEIGRVVEEHNRKLGEEDRALFVVDAVSSLGAMPIHMDEWDIDIVVTGSQKALANPAGLAVVGLSPRAIVRYKEIAKESDGHRMHYFGFDMARRVVERAKEGEWLRRYGPPASMVLGVNAMLRLLEQTGGAS